MLYRPPATRRGYGRRRSLSSRCGVAISHPSCFPYAAAYSERDAVALVPVKGLRLGLRAYQSDRPRALAGCCSQCYNSAQRGRIGSAAVRGWLMSKHGFPPRSADLMAKKAAGVLQGKRTRRRRERYLADSILDQWREGAGL